MSTFCHLWNVLIHNHNISVLSYMNNCLFQACSEKDNWERRLPCQAVGPLCVSFKSRIKCVYCTDNYISTTCRLHSIFCYCFFVLDKKCMEAHIHQSYFFLFHISCHSALNFSFIIACWHLILFKDKSPPQVTVNLCWQLKRHHCTVRKIGI